MDDAGYSGKSICNPFRRIQSAISIPRNYADHIVTEYGIARLKGKTIRERINEIIAIAHPNFRAELGKEGEKLNV